MKKVYYSRIFLLVFILCSVVLVYTLFQIDLLDWKSILIVIFVLLLITLLLFRFCHYKSRTVRVFVTILAISLSVLEIGAVTILNGTSNFFNSISFSTRENVNLVVLEDSKLTLADLKGSDIGIVYTHDLEYYNQANQELQGNFVQADTFPKLIEGLKTNKYKAVMIYESYLSRVRREYPNYDKETKILKSYSVSDVYAKQRTSNLNEEPYMIYISGIDEFGSIPEVGRSDVNMVMNVNPKTHKILITNIPRDSLVKNACRASELPDKLTHIGNFGVSCSMKTVSSLLNMPINYYIKINFSSIQELVDAVGGVDVNSEFAFNSFDMLEPEYQFEFTKGMNHLDGVKALVFARQRNSFVDGDIQRGKNQQAILHAILKKLQSDVVLLNYDKILNSISRNIRTSFKAEEIRSVVREQLDKRPKWNIEMQSLVGEPDVAYTYYYPTTLLSIIRLDETSLQDVIKKINLFNNEGKEIKSNK